MAHRLSSWSGLVGIVAFGFFMITPISYAAATTTIAVGNSVGVYQVLMAKVAHLEALLAALREDETVAKPTFVMAVRGNVVRVDGTLMRHASDMVEICSPMTKGTIDWGDGTSQTLHGLGCSGDTHTFTQYHVYTVPGSYRITLNGGGSAVSKVVAAGKGDADSVRPFSVAREGLTVTLRGSIKLDAPLVPRCATGAVAMVDWGDGIDGTVMNDCGKGALMQTHTYQTAGEYIIIVRDRDGDATQQVISVK